MLYFLLVLLIMLIPFSFRVSAKTESESLVLQAEFVVFGKGIRLVKKRITVKKIFESAFRKRKKSKNKARLFRSAVKRITVEKLNVDSSIGTGNASSTAILGGQVFGLIAPIVPTCAKYGEYRVDIRPVFDKKQFDFFGECVFSLNILNAVLALTEFAGGIKNGKASY